MVACAPYYPVELEIETNTPPVIVADGVDPVPSQTAIPVEIAEGCQATSFSAPVVDYDGAETLFYKWLLTATLDSGSNEIVAQRLLKEATATTADDVALVELFLGEGAAGAAPDARVATIELVLSRDVINSQFSFPESLSGNDKTHLLELYISDRDLGPQLEVEPQPNPGEPRQLAARAAWVLTGFSTEPCGDEVP